MAAATSSARRSVIIVRRNGRTLRLRDAPSNLDVPDTALSIHEASADTWLPACINARACGTQGARYNARALGPARRREVLRAPPSSGAAATNTAYPCRHPIPLPPTPHARPSSAASYSQSHLSMSGHG